MATTVVLQENPKIRLELETKGVEGVFRPIGIIDEDTNFSIALDRIQTLTPPPQALHIDLSRVRRINSCGVREWILFMERLMPLTRCAFVQVNELMIEQANMVPSILGKKGTPVLSFYAPYHCPHCSKDVPVLLHPGQVEFRGSPTAGDLPSIPQPDCPVCKNPMNFDWLAEEYFGFIRHL